MAVCEQVEDPRLAKKLVRREVTRVVTPGTAADSSLNAEENNFLAAVATREIALDLLRLISRRGNSERLSSPGNRLDGVFKKNLNNCGQRNYFMDLRHHCSSWRRGLTRGRL